MGSEGGRFPSAQQWRKLLAAAGLLEVMVLRCIALTIALNQYPCEQIQIAKHYCRCPADSGAMFLFRSPVAARDPPAVPLAAPPLRASDEAMTAWIATYQEALDATEPPSGSDDGQETDVGPVGRLWLHGNVATTPGLLGFCRSAKKETKGNLVRCVFDASHTRHKLLALDVAPEQAGAEAALIQGCRTLDLFMNVFVDGQPGSYRSWAIKAHFPAIFDSSQRNVPY